MIGSALKKLAKTHAMTVSGGIAYGSLAGYAATLCEGNGYKQILFSTRIPDPGKKAELEVQLGKTDIQRVYRVQELEIASRFIRVRFLDKPGTMKKITAFLDWFCPLLREAGANGMDTCVECGCALSSGRWVEVEGAAHYLHDSCAQKLEREIQEENAQRKESDTGNYLTGLLGALAGSALGAVAWALVLLAGYVASVVGLLIGWLAEKGYNLLKGRQGKGKIAILILAIMFGVVLGTFGADMITLLGMLHSGELPGFTLGDLPMFLLYLLETDSEYRTATLGNIAMGLLFAALGVFYILKQTAKDVSGTKFRYLK